jgi:hypothetical protein
MLKQLAKIASGIDWTNPQIPELAAAFYRTVTGSHPDTIRRDALEARVAVLERLTNSLASVGTRSAPRATSGAMDQVIDRLVVAGQQVDEALRFAREDGVAHPEAAKRLARAQEVVTGIERETMRPEVLVSLSPGERAWAETILPELRRARQALHSAPGGGPATIDSITTAAADLGRIQTQLRVARALGWRPPDSASASASASASSASDSYSRYAPDMRVDVGCLPCGRAHLSGAVGMVRNLAAMARERGMADPEVQARIQMASEEITGLWTDDWTPEKVAASPPHERAILEATIPRLRAAHNRLEAARTPQELEQVVGELVTIQDVFTQMDRARSAAMLVPTEKAVGPTHRVTLPAWTYEPPSEAVAMEATSPPDTALAFDRLVRALEERGVRVRFRNLPATETGILEGRYVFDANTINLGAAAMSKDSYAVQILAHEAAHALNDSPRCHIYAAEVPYEERPEEQLAQAVSLISLLEAGLPVELEDGSELLPGERRIDWDSLRASMAPEEYARLLWTSAWVTDAIQGVPRDYSAETCPPTTITGATLSEIRV